MKILLTGGTGLIGKELGKQLVREGHEIILLSRNKNKALDQVAYPCQIIEADINTSLIDLPQIDGVIHLAGESISNKWTEEQKNKILKSRSEGTKNLLSSLKNQKLNFFLGASAIGFYGDTKDELKTETSPLGEGFLAEVTNAWEQSLLLENIHCENQYITRIGVVLSSQGGALEKIKLPFSLGAGGNIGNGQQWFSWIHINDLVQSMSYLIKNKCASGIYNLVAPEPVQNKMLTEEMAKVFFGFHHFTAPKSILRLALGEMADLVLQSQRVSSQKLIKSGFAFQFNHLESAFKDIFKSTLNKENEFYSEQYVDAPIEKVFDFFKDANNLNKITPSDLDFKILSQSTPQIQAGTLFDYKIKINGVPANWRTEILNWNPPYQFVDNQVSGPYKKWHHTHSFEKLGSGTLMSDRVLHVAPLGVLGKVFGTYYIKKQIEKIFSYRKEFIKTYRF